VIRFKFAHGSRVRPTRWLDGGAPKGVERDESGVITARKWVKNTLENRNYYTVKFDKGGMYEVAEDQLRYDNALDDFVDKVQ
jgi:hypothetical protein